MGIEVDIFMNVAWYKSVWVVCFAHAVICWEIIGFNLFIENTCSCSHMDDITILADIHISLSKTTEMKVLNEMKSVPLRIRCYGDTDKT